MTKRFLLLIIIIFLFSFFISYNCNLSEEILKNFKITNQSFHLSDERVNSAENLKSINEKNELVIILITSSTCSYCNHKDFAPTFKKIVDLQKEVAASKFYRINIIGVVNDYNIQRGLEHLNNFGIFDEIIVGNSWSNIGSIRYIYNDIQGAAITPQIIITQRKYKVISHQNSQIRLGIINEEQIHRLVGLEPIIKWYNRGMALPDWNF